jgi:multidrug efflux system outer membrane protein
MRFRGGVDGYLSALDAQRSLYGAEQQFELVRLLRLENRVTLYKALGGGLQEETATVAPVPGTG